MKKNLLNLKLAFIFLILQTSVIHFLYAQTEAAWNKPAFSSISPLYEEMIGNQIYSLWQDLVRNHAVLEDAPFYVSGWGDISQAFAINAVFSLHRTKKDAQGISFMLASELAERSSSGAPLTGVVVVSLEEAPEIGSGGYETLKGGLDFLTRMTDTSFLILLVNVEANRDALQAFVSRKGFHIFAAKPQWELEFFKDRSGRQVLDLTSRGSQELIYEQMVRSGVNPVRAWQAAREAVESFRSTNHMFYLISRKGKTDRA